jgi:NADPH-dependent 2,4-dienoyl-CoA reductase/sulfur reductase-like enzyme
MTLDDALGLEKALNELAEGGKKPSVLIVGAGLIGLKCAEGIYDKAGKITVCDLADRVLSSILDAENASIVEGKLKEREIDFLLGNSVKKFSAGEALMNDGSIVKFDVLVLAVGVRANSEIVKNAGGNVNRGIIVDTRMRTSLPDVYAAGDCAEGYDSSIGSNRVLAILPNAYMQGFTAGVNISGGDAVFDNAIPMNSIGFFGFHIMTAGSYDGECICANRDGTVRKFFVKDGLLKGFMLLGAEERAGIYTSLIREKVPLESISPDFAHNIASNYIFSAEIRRKRLGGAV